MRPRIRSFLARFYRRMQVCLIACCAASLLTLGIMWLRSFGPLGNDFIRGGRSVSGLSARYARLRVSSGGGFLRFQFRWVYHRYESDGEMNNYLSHADSIDNYTIHTTRDFGFRFASISFEKRSHWEGVGRMNLRPGWDELYYDYYLSLPYWAACLILSLGIVFLTWSRARHSRRHPPGGFQVLQAADNAEANTVASSTQEQICPTKQSKRGS